MSSVPAVLVTCRAGWAQGTTASTRPQPLSSTPGIVGKQMASHSPKRACLTHPAVFYLKSHVKTLTKYMGAFARDQCRGNPLRYLGPPLQCLWVFSWWLSREVPFQAVFRAFPGLLKAQLLMWMDSNLSPNIFVVGWWVWGAIVLNPKTEEGSRDCYNPNFTLSSLQERFALVPDFK